MYISAIRLKQIRGFGQLELDLKRRRAVGKGRPSSARMRTVIIGRNGTCKSTLLRCIAIGLSDQNDASGLVSEPIGLLVREGYKNAVIEIELQVRKTGISKVKIRTHLSTDGEKNVVTKQDLFINGRKSTRERFGRTLGKLFVCGYGVGRSTEGSESFRAYRIIDSVYSLFNYEQTLTGAELVLRRLKDYVGTARYGRTLKGVQKALGLNDGHEIHLPKGGGVTIRDPDLKSEIPLQAWADGYRLTFAWLLDLYAWAMRVDRITKSGGINGIILIDEIEQHLHPAMQINMLDRLSELLPDLQIFATTHSPLVALGATKHELVVLKRIGNQVQLEADVPNTLAYSAEDVLVDSRIFNVQNVYKPETTRNLKRFKKLSSITPSNRTKSEQLELKALSIEIYKQPIPGIQMEEFDEKIGKLIRNYAIKAKS